MKAEGFARARLGIADVSEARDDTSCFVEEGQWLLILGPLEFGAAVAGSLIFDRSKFMAEHVLFGFDDAHGFFIDEEDIIRRADIGLVFADGDARASVEVDGFLALHSPSGASQQLVNSVASDLFGILVSRHL